MNDFDDLFSKNYGFKPSLGKSTPMASPKTTSSSSRYNNGGFDSIFGGGDESTAAPPPKYSSMPVFDKPVYDDDVSSSPINDFDDIFAPKKSDDVSSGGGGGSGGGDVFDELFVGLGKKEVKSTMKSTVKGGEKAKSSFDDLLPGFGPNSSMNRTSSDTTKKSSGLLDNPFGDLQSTSHHISSSSGGFGDPLEEFGNLDKTGSKKFETFSSRGVFDDIDPLGFDQAVPSFEAETNGRVKADRGHNSSVTSPERGSDRKVPMEDFGESPHSVFEMPSASNDSSRSVPNVSSPVYNNTTPRESYPYGQASPPPQANMGSSDEVWLTVSEIPLFTQPTIAPPPSRPPPPRPARFSKAESSPYTASNTQSKVNEYSSFPGSNQYFPSPKSPPDGATASFSSPIDDLEEFATGRNHSNVDENSDIRFGENFDTNSDAAASAAAMKEAVDRAEAQFRYARGVREKENAKVSRSKESASVEKEEKTANDDDQDREFREGQERLLRHRQKEREEGEERRRNEEEDRRRIEKEREEKEREKRRVERERELARQAVERATREARERAAIEARNRAERAAVQKANSEARERAERAAVQRAQAEARERAAADAKERAEKAATEAKEKTRSEAREKEARERAAAASMPSQQKNEPDLDSIFGMGTRASSVPRPRATSSGPFESQFQSKPAPDATRNSVNSTSSMRKASSSTNIVDDLTSIFGGTPSSSGDFKDVDGETEDRRRARLERHQRTQERATKALAEKNARDREALREQAERHRISETLDAEIKRWAAGKEGNLRALLSTLQYVLWPECGWQPVSLTDLIMGASVKKVYRKATLCIHPDKVQQKGANLQQKYVAEKVFDLLKEAWNKFNSEELF